MRVPLDRWSGRAFLDVGRAFYLGPAADTDVHAHHAIQICVGLDGPVRLQAEPERRWHRSGGFLVRSDQPHRFDGSGSNVLLLYLEPESHDGRHIDLDTEAPAVRMLEPGVLDSVRQGVATWARGELNARAATALYEDLLRRLGLAQPRSHRLEPRILGVLRCLHERPGAAWRVSSLARDIGLSSRRFRDLFSQEIGMSCRRYILWVRLYAAMEATARGASLTEAAVDVGFADAPHLTRTFRRMFGIAPSAISGSVSFMAPPPGS